MMFSYTQRERWEYRVAICQNQNREDGKIVRKEVQIEKAVGYHVTYCG
jgi:hypothetical protein